ncbi:MAG: hypothetical protein J6U91_07150 [Alistipes sp.]|nr:hypothetical protein [Alistipes sp.]
MNIKWKIALLSVLGFSAAACSSTKKCSKSEDGQNSNIESETEDPRIMLMYGVPFPDGAIARPIEEDKQVTPPATDPDGVPFPGDGAAAHTISSDEAKKLIEQLNNEQEAAAGEQEPRIQRPGVPFPDGEVFKEVSEEEVERLTKEAKKRNRKSKRNK